MKELSSMGRVLREEYALFFFTYINLVVCVGAYIYHSVYVEVRGQTPFGDPVSTSTMWVPGIKLKLPIHVVGTFMH